MDKLTYGFENFLNALSTQLLALNILYADRLDGNDIEQYVVVFPRYLNGKYEVVELVYEINADITNNQQMVNAIAMVIESVGTEHKYSVITREEGLLSSEEPLFHNTPAPAVLELLKMYRRNRT